MMLAAAACSDPGAALERGRTFELEGQAAAAIETYEKYLDRWPDAPGEGEAAFRAARLYDRERQDCGNAVPLYERSARAGGPWAEQARNALVGCPDFFPLPAGAKWVFVDSASGGENMRLELAVRESSGGLSGVIAGAFFAGEERFRDYRREVVKEDWGIWEERETGRSPILRYPFRKGRSWEATEGGKGVRYEIVEDSLTVEVKAGRFEGCLKVKSRTAGYGSWVFDYYCPRVGRVKTTVGAPGVENPNTELSAYTLPK
ncbi:MAG: hypothetical protein AUJ52_13115 [Elusimicrobia bacterium CG1_02_63_36]|nr:MAG: hypothetical protein AUJ52_13115 [Elusimicrobia bacterium CG1_02_63_36]PIP84361.1 MAG: hypothetical protein COR54_04140 [Elusimicrobia bacterium CG22_combo_CG10-13_8_21_14_all_63_91]PJA18614.1 MAG: hypothetical protein COX66_00410 [Elusimicrobia bacterium CG_4_10_14_0_2_um_filter_63_34]PJB23358.1 MAG: hypothetical protein CO113_18125 [Elusimicrobia bacterium CG_4_9_14_3_um_filter_62_55]